MTISSVHEEAHRRFEQGRRAVVLAQMRRLSFLLLPTLALALAVNVRVFGDTMPMRSLALVGMLALTAIVHVAIRETRASRAVPLLAGAFVLALGGMMLASLTEAPRDHDVHLGAVGALVMGAAILIPWGVTAQIAIAGLLALGYAAVPIWTGDLAARPGIVLVLLDCVALSTVGAWVLDRQRRRAFVARERALVAVRESHRLLDASRELNTSLDHDDLAATVTRVGHALLPCDTVALVMVDERRGVLRTASVGGTLLDVDREVIHLEVPTMALQGLLDELGRSGVVRTPCDMLEALVELTRDQFGVLTTMWVAIARDGRLLGYLAFSHRTTATFSDREAELARGFAAQCAIALTNGDLVHQLKRANRVKTEFVATMSHELRTPLSVMLGYVDVLEDAVTDLEARVVLERVRVAGRDLYELVETTLDLGRLESGHDPAQLEPIDMQELWDELATQYAGIQKPTGVTLRWEAHGSPSARTDRRKVKIIVKNLVGNALKFTSQGEVQVSVRAAGDHCLVVVRDTGIGIPDEHLSGIFEMFRQVDASNRRSYGGVGLGLYIVRKLAEQVGATLDVRSQVGQGTTFTLALPLEAPNRSMAAA